MASSPAQSLPRLSEGKALRPTVAVLSISALLQPWRLGLLLIATDTRSRGIGTELTESPVLPELKPHWLAPSELNGFYLCQGLNTGNRRLGPPAHLHKDLRSPFSSAGLSRRAPTTTSEAENAAPILIEEARPHPTKREGPGYTVSAGSSRAWLGAGPCTVRLMGCPAFREGALHV